MVPRKQTPRRIEWLGPINTCRLAAAVMRGQSQVELEITRNKKKLKLMFGIRYEQDHVFVKCPTEYVPCGWFLKKDLAAYLDYMSTGE